MDYAGKKVSFVWILILLLQDIDSQETNSEIQAPKTGDGTQEGSASNALPSTVTTQASNNESEQDQNFFHKDWYPSLNVTCVAGQLALGNNPNCFNGNVYQEKQGCDEEGANDLSTVCETSGRYLECNESEVCTPWSLWKPYSQCCLNITCFFGVPVEYGYRVRMRARQCREDIASECWMEAVAIKCQTGREISNGGIVQTSNGGLKTVAFSLAGTVMVGLLLFAVLRLRKTTAMRQRMMTANHEMQGFDNEVGPTSPDSRLQTILNTINSNGRNFELRERSDSTPGRRVYVLSPGAESGHVTGRSRSLNRMTSQLSSIAEEETEDTLSHITETTEPTEDDCVFRYDSDAINEALNQQSPVTENNLCKPKASDVSSSEALNCINDVIAMYDVDNAEENRSDVTDVVTKASDYHTSTDNENYLNNFGWSPQERSWRLEKLKDGSPGTKLSASLSTLDSQFSEGSNMTSSCSVRDNDSTEPLLGDDIASSSDCLTKKSNLLHSSTFKSLPSVLDTSQIPEIEEVLATGSMTSDDEIMDTYSTNSESRL